MNTITQANRQVNNNAAKKAAEYNPFDYTVETLIGDKHDLTNASGVKMAKDYIGQNGKTVYLWSISMDGNSLTTTVGTDVGGVVTTKQYVKSCLGYYHGKKPNLRWVSEQKSAHAQMVRLVREKIATGYSLVEIVMPETGDTAANNE